MRQKLVLRGPLYMVTDSRDESIITTISPLQIPISKCHPFGNNIQTFELEVKASF